MRFSVRRKRQIPMLLVIGVLLLSMALYIAWRIETHLKPTLLAVAEARSMLIATQSINNVINDPTKFSIDPRTLVEVRLDNRGRVVMIQPNTMEFNKLAADTTIKVQDALKEVAEETFYIPIGQVLGSQLLASMGPRIPVTVIPIGTVKVKVVDKFEQAGINQTRHLVYLLATTDIKIVVPLVSKSVSVNTQVPLAEYVVVGEIPNTYVQFPFPLQAELNNNSNSLVPENGNGH